MNSMEDEGDEEMPSFDGAGWLKGVKIVKCKDKRKLNWSKSIKDSMLSIPKAKVFITSVVSP